MKKEAKPQADGLPPLGQSIKIRREKNGRAGKTVTVLFGFQSSNLQIEALAKQLQKALGTGGTAKEGRVELQGDQLQKVSQKLAQMGYKAVQAGG